MHIIDTEIVMSFKNAYSVLIFYCFSINLFVLSISGYEAILKEGRFYNQ